MAISKAFQERFLELVEDLPDTKRSDVPAKIGISYSIFSNGLNYGIVPKVKVLVRIADFFDCSLEFLLGLSDDENFTKSQNPTPFHMRLEALIEESKMTVYQISQKTHIERSNFSFWRRNMFLPTLEHVEILSDFFDVSFDYLVGRSYER